MNYYYFRVYARQPLRLGASVQLCCQVMRDFLQATEVVAKEIKTIGEGVKQATVLRTLSNSSASSATNVFRILIVIWHWPELCLLHMLNASVGL